MSPIIRLILSNNPTLKRNGFSLPMSRWKIKIDYVYSYNIVINLECGGITFPLTRPNGTFWWGWPPDFSSGSPFWGWAWTRESRRR